MATAVGPVAQKEAKYTQGFEFRRDAAGQDRARQLVERSCTSLMALLQELFLQVEKRGIDRLGTLAEPVAHGRLVAQLRDVVSLRSQVERALLDAVVCAFAALEDRARGEAVNRAAIDRTLAVYRSCVPEDQDLVDLLQVSVRVTQANNQDRPLLVHLNAQLGQVFGLSEPRLHNSPLAPATLTGGLLVGLLSVKADPVAKQMLFRAYEEHFLSKLTLLLNNMTLRLEQEGVHVSRALSFDEADAGPMGDVLQGRRLPDRTLFAGHLQNLIALLEQDTGYVATSVSTRERLKREIAEGSGVGSLALLSELAFVAQCLEPLVTRADVQLREVTALSSIREQVAAHLNAWLAGKQLPVALRDFFQQQWPEVLFEVFWREGLDSARAGELHQWQQQLLDSVTPLTEESQRSALGSLVPRLVRNLREVLEHTGYTLAETHDFFEQLKQLHLANVQQKLDARTFVPWTELSLVNRAAQETALIGERDRALYRQVRSMVVG